MSFSGWRKVRRCAAARASAFVASAIAISPVSAECTGDTVNVMISLAPGSEENCVLVSTDCNADKQEGRTGGAFDRKEEVFVHSQSWEC